MQRVAGRKDMYKKFVIHLFLLNMLVLTSWLCVREAQLSVIAATPAFQRMLVSEEKEDMQSAEEDGEIQMVSRSTDVQPDIKYYAGELQRAASGQRVVDYSVLEKKRAYNLSREDYEALLKIVQAEAGNEDETGKMLVAGVVMNRVKSKRFPNTVQEVVMQQKDGHFQFSPVANGNFQRAVATEETIDAVERILQGEDVSQGALYFVSRKYAAPEKMQWFDNSLKRLFQHGGHEFYR